MKIEKLPSGSYRIRKTYKKKTYTIITDYKPTQKEAIQLMAEELDKVKKTESRKDMTFKEAAEKYIESKRNVLSPSTIRGYNTIVRGLSDWFLQMNIEDMESVDVQKEINRIALMRTPKTTRNYHGFILPVLEVFRPELNIRTTLPQKKKSEPYIPPDEDVKKLIEYSAGTKFEIPIILGCYGLRRSEICSLTLDDLDGDTIRINKAVVLDENYRYVTKGTKTVESERTVVIPMEIADKIREQGYIYKGKPGNITNFMKKAQKELGIQEFTLHKLRHYFASKLSDMMIPEADILKMGGWKTDHVMKGVYRHAMRDKDTAVKREAAKKLGDAIF